MRLGPTKTIRQCYEKSAKIFERWSNLSKIIYEDNTSQCLKDILTNIGQILCLTEVKLTSHPFVSFQFINIRCSSSPAVKIFSFWSFWYTVFLKWSVTPSWNFVMTDEILVTAPSNTETYTKHAHCLFETVQVPGWDLTMHKITS